MTAAAPSALAARIAANLAKADEAIAAVRRARSAAERLAAAKALESAACQLRRAAKAATE